MKHPPLLVLTPALLVAFSVLSIPFLTVLLRLFLLGYFEYPFVILFSLCPMHSPVERHAQLVFISPSTEGTYTYHLKPKADWLIVLVLGLWVWTWGIFRGIGRVTISGVVGEWYFHRFVLSPPSHPISLSLLFFPSQLFVWFLQKRSRRSELAKRVGSLWVRVRDRDHQDCVPTSDGA